MRKEREWEIMGSFIDVSRISHVIYRLGIYLLILYDEEVLGLFAPTLYSADTELAPIGLEIPSLTGVHAISADSANDSTASHENLASIDLDNRILIYTVHRCMYVKNVCMISSNLDKH